MHQVWQVAYSLEEQTSTPEFNISLLHRDNGENDIVPVFSCCPFRQRKRSLRCNFIWIHSNVSRHQSIVNRVTRETCHISDCWRWRHSLRGRGGEKGRPRSKPRRTMIIADETSCVLVYSSLPVLHVLFQMSAISLIGNRTVWNATVLQSSYLFIECCSPTACYVASITLLDELEGSVHK